MTENQATNEAPPPARWKTVLLRAAGFGGGFAIVAAILVGGVIWWSNRPKEWSDKSVTAKPTELYTRQIDEEVRVEFHYAFTNNTNIEYTLPSAESGALMRHVPKTSSVEKLDSATWDTTIRIPPHQSVGIVFSVPYRLAEFSTSNEELDTADKLTEFMGRRLRDINGMTFFDYAAKYRIEMADIIEALPKAETKKAAPDQAKKPAQPIIPPDKGDVFDKVAACDQAEKLLDRCRRANISSKTSAPWTKYGGWPDKLRELPMPPAGYVLDPSPEVCPIAAEWHNYCKAKVK
jgi:hypothetical protein